MVAGKGRARRDSISIKLRNGYLRSRGVVYDGPFVALPLLHNNTYRSCTFSPPRNYGVISRLYCVRSRTLLVLSTPPPLHAGPTTIRVFRRCNEVALTRIFPIFPRSYYLYVYIHTHVRIEIHGVIPRTFIVRSNNTVFPVPSINPFIPSTTAARRRTFFARNTRYRNA